MREQQQVSMTRELSIFPRPKLAYNVDGATSSNTAALDTAHLQRLRTVLLHAPLAREASPSAMSTCQFSISPHRGFELLGWTAS